MQHKKDHNERKGAHPHALKLQYTSLNQFATFGVSGQCNQHHCEAFIQVVLREGECFEDATVEFILQLESAYSKSVKPPFLKGSHQLGVLEVNMYETLYEGYMQLICHWLVDTIEFFPQL